MKLLYRMLSMPLSPSPGWTYANAMRIALDAAKYPKLHLDNVADFFHNHLKDDLSIGDIPNMAPPFGSFWAEWTLPKTFTQNGVINKIDFWAQVGLCGGVTEKNDTLDFSHLIQSDVREKARWVIWYFTWHSTTSMNGQAQLFDLLTVLPVDSNGHLLQICASRIYDTPKCDDDGVIIWQMAMILGLAFSFMHCKNVKRVASCEDMSEKWHKQRKIPKYSFKTLEINPMKEVLRREGRSETTGVKRALHTCRGHFSTYSEDRPLFGKYSGTFWVPDHERGDAKAGEVFKDYSVKV